MLHTIKAAARSAYFSQRLNPFAVRAYSLWRPLPHRRVDMEFVHNAWTGISTLHSADGRQIGENNAAPPMHRETIATEHKACRFAGSRFGLPINVTALRHVMSVWDDVLQFTMLLRLDYLQRRGLGSATRLNLRQAYALSRRAAGCAAYLARRRESPLHALPRLETAFFTMGVAPYLLAHALLEGGDLAVLDPAPLAPDAAYRIADACGALISPVSGKACAGSARLIVRFFDVMLHGAFERPLDSAEALRAIDGIGDLDRFDAYVESAARLELLIKLQQSLCAHALLALQQRDAAAHRPPRPGLGESLEASFYRRATPLDDGAVLRHGVRGLMGLLQELGSPAAAALVGAGIVDADHAPAALPSRPDDAGRAAADRIRQSAALLHALARQALQGLHEALARFPQGHPIGVGDFLVRCGGPALPPLLQQLEAAAPVQPAWTAAPGVADAG